MKQGIHPHYHTDAQVTCACGNTFATGSTKQTIHVEICAACHPFFTGEMKYVDTAGRVDKFKAKIQAAQTAGYQKKKDKKAAKMAAEKAALAAAPRSMKDMLAQAKKQSKADAPTSSNDNSSATTDDQ